MHKNRYFGRNASDKHFLSNKTMPEFITKSLPAVFVIALAALLTGCSQNDAQKKFEEEAFAQPSGITQTDVQGKIVTEDSDDWRIGPMFKGYVEVESPAFPNPVSNGQNLEIHLNITGIESISGLEVMVRDENDNWRSIYLDSQSSLPPGLYTFQLNPSSFSYTNNYQNAVGLHRVYLFDLNNNLITYGDVRVQ